MDLKDVDLNLLVVFNQLLLQQRVGQVAVTLGLTQPAVSNALARLRRLLGDELFLRTPQGMVPTPLAARLAGPVADALGLLHGALNQPAAFDAARSARRFNVGMSDIGEIYFLPTLLDLLARQAPQVTLNTVRNSTANLKAAMQAGEVDLAVGLLPQLQGGFFQRRLFSQRYVCLFRHDHPLARKRSLSLRDFLAAGHVQVVAADTGHGRVDALMARSGTPRDVRLTVPHFVAVGHILASTDLIATVPERFAQRCAAPFKLVQRPHPVALPAFDVHVFWHAQAHRDAANQWLRGLLFETFASAAG